MSKGIFVTATGTDAGKTYVSALIVKKLRQSGVNAGYYKAALSGAESVAESDAGYVNRAAEIGESEDMLLSYLYKNPLSPHLAAKIEGNPVEMEIVERDFARAANEYDYLTVEGSGGIVCPIRYDGQKIFLEDIIKRLGLSLIMVADSGLGSINAAVTTAQYIASHNMQLNGIILNHWNGSAMQEDNRMMIERLTNVPVCAVVRQGDTDLEIDTQLLKRLYREI